MRTLGLALTLSQPPTDILSALAQATPCLPPAADTVVLIDYRLPSTQPRLWLWQRSCHRVLLNAHVSHGQGSGMRYAQRFSNRWGSHASSLGFFLIQGRYLGRHGISLALHGLEPGFNDHARVRHLVIHQAAYVSQASINHWGRAGRSWGCPAVSQASMKTLSQTLTGRHWLLIYYPDKSWLSTSTLLHCHAHFRK